MLDAHGHGFLAGREMTEAANFLFFVKSVRGEFEASVALLESHITNLRRYSFDRMHLPNRHHIPVQPSKFPLRRLQCIWRGI